MDGPWEHYVNGNTSERHRQIAYNLTYVWNLKTKQNSKLWDIENRLVVARGAYPYEEIGEMGESFQKVQTSSYKIIVTGI